MVHCFWPGALQLDLNINYAIFTPLDSLLFRSHPYGCKFYLVFYFFGFAAAIGKWASISLYLMVSMRISCHGQFQRYSRSKFVTNWNPSNAWSQKIESKKLPRPTSAGFSTVPTVWYPHFFPHTKLFEKTNGYFHNDTMYLENFLWPPNNTHSSLFTLSFSVEAPDHFQHLNSGVSCRVRPNAKQP